MYRLCKKWPPREIGILEFCERSLHVRAVRDLGATPWLCISLRDFWMDVRVRLLQSNSKNRNFCNCNLFATFLIVIIIVIFFISQKWGEGGLKLPRPAPPPARPLLMFSEASSSFHRTCNYILHRLANHLSNPYIFCRFVAISRAS